MKNKFTEELITAYLDNEIKNGGELRQLQDMISKDPLLDFDLKAASITKGLLKKKTRRKITPDKLKANIIKNISDESRLQKKGNFISSTIYSQRYIAYSTAGVILLALLLLLFNRPDFVVNNISKQTGENNMLVMAENYFENFLSGNNPPQFTSNNADEIKNFFRTHGVKYSTFIPLYENFSLAGASVTEHNGVKFAHHLYSSKNGKYIYIFQVHESYFKGDSIIHLTNDLLNYIKNGSYYKTKQKNYFTILKQKNENVFAVVSNLTDIELPEDTIK